MCGKTLELGIWGVEVGGGAPPGQHQQLGEKGGRGRELGELAPPVF